MLSCNCQCGGIRITIAKRPDFIHECNCTLCQKVGARWGYFQPSEVVIDGGAKSYRRTDKSEPAVDVHFCANCGSTTHFTLTEMAISKLGNTMLGVNMYLLSEAELAGVELRFPDGRSWSGEGAFGYVRGHEIIGDQTQIDVRS